MIQCHDLDDAFAGVDRADPVMVLARALDLWHPRIALACSFSMEDAVLVHLLAGLRADPVVFALDTGRLNPETYACAEALRLRYQLDIRWYFPAREPVEALERTKGLFSFRENVDNRKECCGIRKVEPLRRALAGMDAWITGLRREQSVTRIALDEVEIDAANGGIVKVNPLASWTLEQTRAFVLDHAIPYNTLYDQGYASIGCAPCTRAVQAGEDQRAGRWWWEQPEHKECGLHNNPRRPTFR